MNTRTETIQTEHKEPLNKGDLPVLNRQLLSQYDAMDAELPDEPLLPKLIGIFQKNIPEHLNRLEIAVKSGNAPEAAHLIHKMLGMSHNAGALRLSDQFLAFEQGDDEKRLAINSQDMAIFFELFHQADAALTEYVLSRHH